MRVIFFGTPDFAIPCLEAVVAAGHTVVAVICQPDRAKDRKGNLLPVPLKAAAIRLGLPVYGFERIRDQIEFLTNLKADIGVTAAYGQILTQEVLDIPRYGIINVHASLLPKYRGSSPIQWAVMNGEKTTGVTIMQTERGLDCGDILAAKAVDVPHTATAGEMFEVLGALGADLLVDVLRRIEKENGITGIKQDESQATKCAMLKKEDGLIDWAMPADRLYNRIRGLNPWPMAYTFWAGQPFKICKAQCCAGVGTAGAVIESDATVGKLTVACGQDALRLLEVQVAGKRAMDISSFLRGHSIPVGTVFENGV